MSSIENRHEDIVNRLNALIELKKEKILNYSLAESAPKLLAPRLTQLIIDIERSEIKELEEIIALLPYL